MLLGGVAWVGSGRILERRAVQEVSDRWREVEVCLLGEGAQGPRRPSERVRLVRLATAHGPLAQEWPARCLDAARVFDETAKSRAARAALGDLPSAARIIADVDERRAELDHLAAAIAAADLPLPRRAPEIAAAPPVQTPQLRGDRLPVLGTVERLDAIDAAFDPGARRALRLLLPEAGGLAICNLDDDWREARCRTSPIELPPRAKARLAPAPNGAVDLVHVVDGGDADGFYDAATGLRVHRSDYFDTQAFVEPDGRTTVLTAQMKDGEVRGFRLLRMKPGDRPSRHKLRSIPSDARPVLMRDAVLWWPHEGPDRVPVYLQPLAGGDDRVVATVPKGSRPVSHCRDGDRVALLVAAGVHDRRYTVLLGSGEDLVARGVGVIHGAVELSCHGDAAYLQRWHADASQGGSRVSLTRWRCRADGCLPDQLSDPPRADPGGDVLVGSLDDRFAVAWRARDGDALRLRTGDAEAIAAARDVLLLDESGHETMRPIAMRWIAKGDLGLLLLLDEALRVRLLRVTPTGDVEAVAVER